MALDIVENAKIQRPGVCNSIESLLVHERIAEVFLPELVKRLGGRVELRGCEKTCKIIAAKPAAEDDWSEEYLDLVLAVKIVRSFEEALAHIAKYGSMHSETIITENYQHAMDFVRK